MESLGQVRAFIYTLKLVIGPAENGQLIFVTAISARKATTLFSLRKHRPEAPPQLEKAQRGFDLAELKYCCTVCPHGCSLQHSLDLLGASEAQANDRANPSLVRVTTPTRITHCVHGSSAAKQTETPAVRLPFLACDGVESLAH